MNSDLAKRLSLVDCCDQLVELVARLEQDQAATTADDLRAAVERRLLEFEGTAQRAGVGMGDIDAARYALVALVDERILCSELAATADWLGAPLQMKLYGTFEAGEEFYRRIDELRRDPAGPRILALEVYHLCLALGFKGKHDDRRGAEQRKVILDQIAQLVAQTRGIEGRQLAPQAHREAAAGTAVARGLPLWLWPAISAAAAILILIVLALMTGSAVDAFAGEGR